MGAQKNRGLALYFFARHNAAYNLRLIFASNINAQTPRILGNKIAVRQITKRYAANLYNIAPVFAFSAVNTPE
jgi:hypothetical protein